MFGSKNFLLPVVSITFTHAIRASQREATKDIGFTFNLDNNGLVDKLVVQTDNYQHPNFTKINSVQTHVRKGGIHYSKIESQDKDVLVVKVISEEPDRLS